MRKQYTLEQNRIEDIQKDPSKYLPIALYTIGCHMGEMTNREIEGLIDALALELRHRDVLKKDWENTDNAAYCEGHSFT